MDEDLVERATTLLAKANLPTELPEGCPLTESDFNDAMAIDKKVADGVLRLILLKGELGNCVFTADYDKAKLRETLEWFCDDQQRTRDD